MASSMWCIKGSIAMNTSVDVGRSKHARTRRAPASERRNTDTSAAADATAPATQPEEAATAPAANVDAATEEAAAEDAKPVEAPVEAEGDAGPKQEAAAAGE